MILLAGAVTRGLLLGGVYALIALGFVLIYKSTQILNFAQGYMVMLGGFICFACTNQLGLPLPVGLILSLAAGYGMGLFIERTMMRPMIGQPILAAVIMTLALSSLLDAIRLGVWGEWGRSLGFFPLTGREIGPLILSDSLIICFIVALVAIGAFLWFFRRSMLGLAMRGVGEDNQLAQSVGVKVKMVFSTVWGISGVISVIGGILLGAVCTVGTSLANFGMIALAVALFGGLESVGGCLAGGLVVGVAEQLASTYLDPLVTAGGVAEVFPYVLMMIVLIVRPYGLFGLERIERV